MTMPRRGFLAGAAGLAAPPAYAQGGAPLRIGILTDMNGPFSANTGMTSVLSARLAIEDFGPSVLGRPIELLTADHQNKPEVALTIARKWFDQDGVDLIADPVNTSIALAVMNAAQERGKITFFTGSGSTTISNEACTATNVQWTYDTFATASTVARPLIAAGKRTWFFVTADYAFGASTEADARRVVEDAGGKVLGSVRHPPGTVDFASYLLQAQASGADVVAFASAGADTANAITKEAVKYVTFI